jgi:hypothetical protein
MRKTSALHVALYVQFAQPLTVPRASAQGVAQRRQYSGSRQSCGARLQQHRPEVH